MSIYPVPAELAKKAFVTEPQYKALYQQSIEAPEQFWGEQARHYINWIAPWDKVLSGGFDLLDVQWFAGGKLNAAANCLDRHLEKRGKKTAIIWEGDEPGDVRTFSYQQLHHQVCLFANVLKKYGIKKGDRVCIYMPMVPEAVIAMLACARIGAVHTVVFGGFSAESLSTRIQNADCKLLVTANEGLRGGKTIPLKQQVDKALSAQNPVQTVIVFKRTENKVEWQHDRDVWYHDVMATVNADCPPHIMDAQDPLFILYTSGSTGTPKGILHGTGGYMVYAAMTHKLVFDCHEDDIYWCTADIGWVTGHTYGVYGPLANGATILMYEGIPTYPSPARSWEMIDRHRVSIFYTAPTAIRALRREGDQYVTSTSRQSLRILGSVGEPINPEAWEWYYQVVGGSRCPVVDTWWQTETGGIMVSALPGATALKPGYAAWPFFGVEPAVIDDNGKPAAPGVMGRLIIKSPWPGMMQTVYGRHERFVETYFKEVPGAYVTGDLALCDQDGYYCIEGRSDDVIKVSGHRIGTQEVESALVMHADVSEAAAVGKTDPIKGQHIYAFVVLKAGKTASENLITQLKQQVRDAIGPIAVPDEIQLVSALPKTRSGKIMRRLLRKIVNQDTQDMGDLSTLADPGVVAELLK